MATFFATIGTVILGGALVFAIVALGWWLAMQQLQAEQRQLRLQRELLNTEWQTLDQTRRLREIFLVARRAMQHQADADERRGGLES